MAIGCLALAALFCFGLIEVSANHSRELPALAAPQNSSPLGTAGLISAAKGGELTAPSGRASLIVPAGALAADTRVSIAELPPAAGPAVGPVYDLQPDGLRFARPATFIVRYKAADVPKGYKPEDVAIMQVLPGPESKGQGGLGAAAAAAAQPPYQNLETKVDLAAGTASAQLSHLSRYTARAYATFDLNEWNGVLAGSFDFGQSDARHSGEADARSAYDLLGKLEAVVWATMGKEGQGWAWACLWQSFRVGPRQPRREADFYGERDIEVPIFHRGTISPGTNTYDVQYNVWLSSDEPKAGISAGMFVPQGGGPAEGTLPEAAEKGGLPPQVVLVLPGIYWQSFTQRPGLRTGAVWSPGPYKPQSGSVVFRNVRLYRDHFYAVGVAIFAAIKARPGRKTRPPEGGSISFLAGDFIVHPVRIRQPATPSGGQP